MHRWSELAEKVAATTRTSEKTSLLAAYLRTLDLAELRVAAVFLSGRPFPEADQRATGLGWATIATGISTAAATRTFSAIVFIVFLLNISSPAGAVYRHNVRQAFSARGSL